MHQFNEVPNRLSFAEVQRQLKEATGALDADVRAIRPISLRRNWVICMTRFAATMTNRIWGDIEDGSTASTFYFTLDKFPDVPIFALGQELKVRIDLNAIDTAVTWDSCEWQPPSK